MSGHLYPSYYIAFMLEALEKMFFGGHLIFYRENPKNIHPVKKLFTQKKLKSKKIFFDFHHKNNGVSL